MDFEDQSKSYFWLQVRKFVFSKNSGYCKVSAANNSWIKHCTNIVPTLISGMFFTVQWEATNPHWLGGSTVALKVQSLLGPLRRFFGVTLNKLIDATLTYLDCTWPPHDFHRPPKCPRESSKMVLELLQTISVNCCHFDDTDDRIRLILETWTKISHHSSWIRAIKGRFWYKGESSPKSAHFWNVLCLYHTTHGYIPKSTGKYWTCVFTNNDFCHSDSILL